MRELAEAVGLTKPALYYHFSSKEALFLAAVHTHMDCHRQDILTALDTPGSLRERLPAPCRPTSTGSASSLRS